MAELRDTLPSMWYALYTGCTSQGFSEQQAMALVQTFILTQAAHGVQPPTPPAPGEDGSE